MSQTLIARSVLILASAGALAACATEEPVADLLPPLGPAEEIGAADVRGAVTGQCGQENFAELVGRPGAEINRRDLPANHRILSWDSFVTMEYRGDRLTIQLDEAGSVQTVACG